jgi:hypothetical protein
VLGRTLPPRSLLTPSAGRKGVLRNQDALFLLSSAAKKSLTCSVARLAANGASGYDSGLSVSSTSQPILCDGCGLAASPEHIRERLARLEVATRFRPIHISVLFLIPSPDADGDFYDAAPRILGARDMLLDALGIFAPSGASAVESRLAEFQRHGFYFAAASECPLSEGVSAEHAVTRLAPTLLKRIQFSYRPKSVVLLSDAFVPLVPLLAPEEQGIRVLPNGATIAWPRVGDGEGESAFRAACARVAEIART